MHNDVTVKIDLAKPIGKVGFGVPLILCESAVKAVEYVECANIAEVAEAGFAAASKAYKAAQLIFAQVNAPKRIAMCAVTEAATAALADEALTSKDWRQLIVVNEGESETAVADLITAVEALEGKMLFVSLDVEDSTAVTATGLRHTILFYVDATDEAPVPAAALVGESAGREAGSFTYKNLILHGIAPQKLTDAQLKAIHDKGGITFVAKAGDNVTSEGKVAGGEYIDVIDSEDYIVQQIAYKTQKVLNNAAKVPYTNAGIAMLESAVVDVLQSAYNNGMIATKADGTPDYSVDFALREDTTAENRNNRHYPYGNFGFALAGAIHTAYITGEITV